MDLRFTRERARYNPLNVGKRRYLQKTEEVFVVKAAEDPRDGGGFS
jgi:hypothetical protein